ncbi:MAG: UDP-N-acetylmuramoyl-L-alanine--D-glutamate ligase, partial [Clostridia bacterium]|nr:UDP-N-acetylmuramoyl-L-alanine--D-glutamate ligase [Clostridia bacterium]
MTEKIRAFQQWIKGKTVSVIGIGISNRPLIDFLLDCGALVTAHDKKTEEELGETAQELRQRGVSLVLGEKYLDDVCGEIVFRTPGVRYDHPGLVNAQKRGATITSEMEVFMALCPAHMIAITGSDGKTTTTTLIYNMLTEAGFHTYLGGNIGTPLLSKVGQMCETDYVVLEISSFQLHTMQQSPHIAVVTNITPNHLDYHTDYAEYIAAKKNIFMHQSRDDVAVLNLDNDVTRDFVKETAGHAVTFSKTCKSADVYFDGTDIYADGKKILSASDIKIPGGHNIENYMTA